MKCKQCGKDCSGKSQYCSESCKTVYNRNKRKPGPEPEQATGTRVTVEHYHANRDMYATRTNPDKLNWGPWLNSEQLYAQGLIANRVTIPGDWDYEGTPDTPDVKDMSDLDLQLRLKSYQGTDWVNSPEYKEVVRRRQVKQQMINDVARTGCEYSYTTVKGVVQPLTVHRTSASA